jgi:hypothetical protein
MQGQQNRDNKTAIELFLAGVQSWEVGIRRRLGESKPDAE